jgi:sporulation protein YlmC with PRC-barrel domain
MTIAETTQFTIGAEANGSDGTCGTVTQIVIDPVGRVVTHLIVEPKHRQGIGRLVPLALVETTTDGVELRCTTAEFDELERAEETQFLPGTGPSDGYGEGQTRSWPYYIWGGDMGAGMGMGMGNVSEPVIVDTIPLGEVAVRRGDHVRALDGDIGKVQGLVIAVGNHGVTHVLLQEGHLWGRKDVAIPIGAVSGVDDGIAVNLTKQQVQDLPPADISHPTS